MAGPWESYAAPPADDGRVRPRVTIYANPSAERPSAEGSGPWSNYEAPQPSGKSISDKAYGLYKAADAGAARGVAGLAGMIGDITDAGANALGKATNFVEGQLGLPETPAPDRSGSLLNKIPTSESVGKSIQDSLYNGEKPYQPQGVAEDYARSFGEFIPAALAMPGGVAARVAQVVVPGVASETAGRLTKGTAAEPYARAGAALAGSAGASFLTRPGTTARAIREQLPEGVTTQMVDQAEALIQRAAQQGVTLSWPEALSQTAGRPVLSNVARHLEAAPQTEARMAEFYGQRPQQIERAGRGAIDNVAPANNAPSTIGPAVGQAAEGVANDVRGAINAASEPLYTAASTVRLPPAEMARVTAHPGWAEARAAVRNDPQLNRYVANLQDDQVGFLNEVKKYLDQAAENASAPVNAGRNMQRSAGYGADAEAVRNTATRASGDYAYALEFQRQAREQYLQPLLDGPIGKLASRDITTKNAIDALFPSNPLPNSAAEIGQTVGVLARRSPNVAGDLVRAHVESVFNEATQALQSGANQAGGAKFAAVLMGNPQQRANLEAAITALPNGAERLAGFNRFMEVAQATGTRQGIGSRTAYNAEMLKNQSASGIIGEGAKAAANPLKGVQFLADKYERWRLGQNLDELAAILTSPQSGNQLRAIARMAPGSRQAGDVALRVISSVNTGRSLKPVEQPRQ